MIRSVLLILFVSLVGGCASSGPYAPLCESARDTRRAQDLTQRAADLILTDTAKAESLLRDALTADLYHGPAHNNLGTIYLERGQLYEAASEFEWARRLMPGHPDPRLNLGLALERAGKIDAALDSYRTALDVYPGHLPSIQALARCQIRHGRTDDRTPAWLEEIAMRGDAQWREWARERSFGLPTD